MSLMERKHFAGTIRKKVNDGCLAEAGTVPSLSSFTVSLKANDHDCTMSSVHVLSYLKEAENQKRTQSFE